MGGIGGKIVSLIIAMAVAVIAVIIGVNILVELLPEANTTISSAIASGGGLNGMSGASLLSLIPGMLLLVFGAGVLIAVIVLLVQTIKEAA